MSDILEIYNILKETENDDVYFFSFETIPIVEKLLSLDKLYNIKCIVVLNTPMDVDYTEASGKIILSKHADIKLFYKIFSIKNLFCDGFTKVILTKQEKIVLNLFLNGVSYDSIAYLKKLSKKTIYSHIDNSFKKTHISRKGVYNYLKYGKFFLL
jgi:DNA-binding CsgD family transcriptional regulator